MFHIASSSPSARCDLLHHHPLCSLPAPRPTTCLQCLTVFRNARREQQHSLNPLPSWSVGCGPLHHYPPSYQLQTIIPPSLQHCHRVLRAPLRLDTQQPFPIPRITVYQAYFTPLLPSFLPVSRPTTCLQRLTVFRNARKEQRHSLNPLSSHSVGYDLRHYPPSHQLQIVVPLSPRLLPRVPGAFLRLEMQRLLLTPCPRCRLSRPPPIRPAIHDCSPSLWS